MTTTGEQPKYTSAYEEFLKWKNSLQGNIATSDTTIIKSAAIDSATGK
jgi:hypothetical protein